MVWLHFLVAEAGASDATRIVRKLDAWRWLELKVV